MVKEDITITGIDTNDALVKRATEDLDIAAIAGSASNPSILKEAGIGDADMVLDVTNNDEVNIVGSLIAKYEYQIPITIARITTSDYFRNSNILKEEYVNLNHILNVEKEAVRKIINLIKYNIFNYYEDDYKDKMRKLILRNNYYTEDEKDDILEYCMHDTLNSHKLFKILCNEFEKIFNRKLDINIFTTIGNYVKAAAHVSWVGIPVDIEYLDAITTSKYAISSNILSNSCIGVERSISE